MSERADEQIEYGTAVWMAEPENGVWNSSNNWSTGEVPSDTAVFKNSTITSIEFEAASCAGIKKIEFEEGASSYVFCFKHTALANEPTLTIEGEGVINHSGQVQKFSVASTAISFSHAQLKFSNSASAGCNLNYYYSGPPTPEGPGGGVIRFEGHATAECANFIITTGEQTIPHGANSTVGGEVSFGDYSTAANAHFLVSGSTGTDGDTFGNAVFHNSSTAANAQFTNTGGTVPGGDGGNTQFYDSSTAANAVFQNQGGTAFGVVNGKEQGANGGDVAFDGTATGANGCFHNYAATVKCANGGVTSFNNNPPEVSDGGATAGHGYYYNYGANGNNIGGGGHTEFTAKHGSPSGGYGRFVNYGSELGTRSCAGHTVLSTTSDSNYFPSAGDGIFWNCPAPSADGVPGFTEFTVYKPYPKESGGSGLPASTGAAPTAGNAVFYNLGGNVDGASGGVTEFSATSTADNATLIAYGGTNGGGSGRIEFSGDSVGANAAIELNNGGVLSVSHHSGVLTARSLTVNGSGSLKTQVGNKTTLLCLTTELVLNSATLEFVFDAGEGFMPNTNYKVLTAANLSDFDAQQFRASGSQTAEAVFTVSGNDLLVSFSS